MSKYKINRFSVALLFLLFYKFTLLAQLKDNTNKCDYLIISPSQFTNSLNSFINWRQSKGLTLKLVELENIYNEFPDLNKSKSIRNFISFALTHWSDPKPKFVLLVGGIKFIPSYRVLSQFSNSPFYNEDSVSIDGWYSVNQFDSDNKEDIVLGRFPINNNEELFNIISKTIKFEDSLSVKVYPTHFTFLTDKTDAEAFERTVNSFIQFNLPIAFSKSTIFTSQDTTIDETRNKLFDQLSTGTMFLNYFGHGQPNMWSDYKIFEVKDISTLASNKLPFIYCSAACSQSYDLPDDSSIVRELIILSNSGTVASIAATGLNYLALGSDFLSRFYNFLFKYSGKTIGEAFLSAKSYGSSIIDDDDFTRRYSLLGDPALRIQFGLLSNITYMQNDLPKSHSLKQNYPNPFNASTIIEYTIPHESFVTISVYNVLGEKISTLVDEKKHLGNYQVMFDGKNLTNGVYFYQMNSGNYVETRKLMLIK